MRAPLRRHGQLLLGLLRGPLIPTVCGSIGLTEQLRGKRSGMKVTVQHAKETFTFDAGEGMKVAALSSYLEEATGVIARHQKLIFKGRVLAPDSLLTECKLTDGSKVMLLSTTGITQVRVPARLGSPLS